MGTREHDNVMSINCMIRENWHIAVTITMTWPNLLFLHKISHGLVKNPNLSQKAQNLSSHWKRPTCMESQSSTFINAGALACMNNEWLYEIGSPWIKPSVANDWRQKTPKVGCRLRLFFFFAYFPPLFQPKLQWSKIIGIKSIHMG